MLRDGLPEQGLAYVKRVVSATVVIGSLVACTAENGASDQAELHAEIAQGSIEQPSPTDDLLHDVMLRVQLTDALQERNAYRIEDADAIVAELDAEDRAQLPDLIDALEARHVLTVIHDTKTHLNTTDIPATRATITAAQNQTTRDLGLGALARIEVNQVFSELNTLSTATEYETARQDIATLVSDPALLAENLRKVDVLQARNIYGDYGYGSGVTYEQAIAEAQNVQDEAVRQLLLEGIEAQVAYRANYSNHEALRIGNDVYSQLQRLELDLDITPSPYTETPEEAFLAQIIEDQLTASDQLVDSMILSNNLLAPGVGMAELSPLVNPTETVDLTNVTGTKPITDDYAVLTDDLDAPNLAQFAEIYAQNGDINLVFQADTGLSAETETQFTQLFERLKPLLYAGFANGDITSVHFVIDGDYNPYYLPATGEIVMVLPQDDSTSLDQLHSGLIHETIHALTETAFEYGHPSLTPEEIENMNAACTNVRDSSLTNFEYIFDDVALDQVIEDARPEHQVIFEQLKQHLSERDLSTILLDSLRSSTSLSFNNCYGLGFGDVLYTVAREALGSDTEFSIEDLQYLLEDNEHMQAFYQSWSDAQEYLALYNRFNEAAYVDTDYIYQQYLGHSQDNTTEMVASLVDATISFTPEFIETLRTMSASDRLITIQAMRASFDLITNRHPDLAIYFETLETNIITGANQ